MTATDPQPHEPARTAATPTTLPENGPRAVRPKLTRIQTVHTTSYTLTIANAVDIRLTDRQARDLYQQFHEEFAPKARFT